jgi:hypothetical protein
MSKIAWVGLLAFGVNAGAKSFQNSYVSFEVPDDWACVQEGVAWTCTPVKQPEAKQAVIVMAAKVAGAEDTIPNFVNYLKQPRRITTKVGTPMPSQVMYSQTRTLAGGTWVQAQHVSSEIQDYYTLYLATVKEQLAILVSFSAEKTNYAKFNPIFDRALKTLKITADQHVLFPKGRQVNKAELVGIQAPGADLNSEMALNVAGKTKSSVLPAVIAGVVLVLAVGLIVYRRRRPKRKPSKSKSSRR